MTISSGLSVHMKKPSREKDNDHDHLKSGDLVSVIPINNLTGYIIPAAIYLGSTWDVGDDEVPYAIHQVVVGDRIIVIRDASHALELL